MVLDNLGSTRSIHQFKIKVPFWMGTLDIRVQIDYKLIYTQEYMHAEKNKI